MLNFRKTLTLIPATLLLALLACTSIESMAYEGCPASIDNFYDCEHLKETKLLCEKPALGVRQGDKLEIRLAHGESLILVDRLGNDVSPEDTEIFALVKDFPGVPYVLLTVSLWEGSNYYLLNLITGERTLIGGDALLSPDMKRFVAWRGDDQYADSTLQVYRIVPDELRLEYEVKTDAWWPEQVQWCDEQSISFQRVLFSEPDTDVQKESWSLRRESNQVIPAWEMKPMF